MIGGLKIWTGLGNVTTPISGINILCLKNNTDVAHYNFNAH